MIEKSNVITLDPRPCFRCGYSYVIGSDRLGLIYGCKHILSLYPEAKDERRDPRGCGPSARRWVRKETKK